ncbi:MAG TPA: sulfotransferase [Steroidobacteraceae bacterium]|nr:sulfotransferase [Steroidobacteraceae bacterium]
MESPVFLVGSERSGTTLLRLMLDHHPDIAFNLESEFLVSEVSDWGVFPKVADYRRKLREDRVFRHSGFEIADDLDFPALVNDFLFQKLERDRKRVVGATVHYGFSRLKYLWPRAKYIYLLRDGRDVAASVVEMGWAGNAFAGTKWWLDAEREWAEFKSSLPRDRWIEVRYEDLVADSEAQLQRVCDLIGVKYSPRMFDYAESSSYSLPDPAQVAKWRRKLPPRDLQYLEAQIGPQLAARGYELCCTRPQRIGPTHMQWLEWRSRVKLLQRRIAKFGFWLFALELASRRLGCRSINSRARHAIDTIIDQNLK